MSDRETELLEEVREIMDKLRDLSSDENAEEAWQQFGQDLRAWNNRAEELLDGES